MVTHFDGLVLARSAFHRFVHYRSVMLFGEAVKVGNAAREERLQSFVQNLIPGRWETLRPMTAKEAKATTVFSMPIDEGSAKIRTGPPVDDEEDYSLPIWAGVLPISQVLDEPVPDPKNLGGLEVPTHIRNFELG